jgi:hypothetical protein
MPSLENATDPPGATLPPHCTVALKSPATEGLAELVNWTDELATTTAGVVTGVEGAARVVVAGAEGATIWRSVAEDIPQLTPRWFPMIAERP